MKATVKTTKKGSKKVKISNLLGINLIIKGLTHDSDGNLINEFQEYTYEMVDGKETVRRS